MSIFNFFRKEVKRLLKTESAEEVPYVIELRNVIKRFDDKLVLDGVNLKVKNGEILAVIGPSGCGKSTLLRSIIGLFPVTGGEIIVGGDNLTKLNEEEMAELRRKFGMVFQSSALFDSLTVGENVSFGLAEHSKLSEDEIKKIVSEKLSLVGMAGTENLMPSELSGGMQKRVSLARAIATNPEIMLYDEPTTGLDPVMQVSIEDLMIDLHKKLKVTAIVVTHMLETVYRIADRIAMLHKGKIIEAGTVEETKRSTNPIIREFITGRKET